MRLLNAQYRGIDRVTDVLSFPQYSDHRKLIKNQSLLKGHDMQHMPALPLGDIVICIPRLIQQANKYNVTFYEEMSRLLIHGLLHLIGYDHEKNSYHERKMKKKEREILDAIKTMA